MGSPSAFQIGHQIGTNFNNSMTRVRDENTIDSILSQAMNSGDPAVLQHSIGKILAGVSPERQGLAVQYLQGAIQNIENNRTKASQREALLRAGVDPNLPPELQKAQYEEMANQNRFANIAGNGHGLQSISSPADSIQQSLPTPNGAFGIGASQSTPLQQEAAKLPQQSIQSGLRALSDDQLVQLTGVKGYSEPAKQELKRRQEERKIDQSRSDLVFKSDLDRSSKFLEKVATTAESIPQKDTALKLMTDAVTNGNLRWFSPDNIADVTGIEGLRSPEGALFKTAAKEYFLGNISRVGSRPNQWVEQQILDMMPKIGRSVAANLSVKRALENELDLDKEKVRLTDEISDLLREKGDTSLSKLDSTVNKELRSYADRKQKELFNDLRAIKAIDEKKPQKFMPVEKGTPITKVVAQALLQQSGNDPKKAASEAKKLGYSFE